MKSARFNKKLWTTALACAAGGSIGLGAYSYYRVSKPYIASFLITFTNHNN